MCTGSPPRFAPGRRVNVSNAFAHCASILLPCAILPDRFQNRRREARAALFIKTRADDFAQYFALGAAQFVAADCAEETLASSARFFAPTRAGNTGSLHRGSHLLTGQRDTIAPRVRAVVYVTKCADGAVEQN